MSASEITVIHELFAKYNVILSFAENNLRGGMDKKMTDSVNDIKAAFIKYRNAIEELSHRITAADKELGRHILWPHFKNTCKQYERLAEGCVVSDILNKLGLS